MEYYNLLSIFVAVSTRESFGVAVLEAAACGIPSITSNVGGLPEVNIHNKTGFVIPPENPKKLADSIMKLYKNETLRKEMSGNAKKRVVQAFNWDNNVNKMISIYESSLSDNDKNEFK